MVCGFCTVAREILFVVLTLCSQYKHPRPGDTTSSNPSALQQGLVWKLSVHRVYKLVCCLDSELNIEYLWNLPCSCNQQVLSYCVLWNNDTKHCSGGEKKKEGNRWNEGEFHRSWSRKLYLPGQVSGFLCLYEEPDIYIFSLQFLNFFLSSPVAREEQNPFSPLDSMLIEGHLCHKDYRSRACCEGSVSCTTKLLVFQSCVSYPYLFFCLYPIGKAQNFRPGNGFEDEHTEQQQSKHAERGSTYE